MKNFIIAEAGSNHNGDINKALHLIDIAHKANADSVKFQFIFSDGLYLPAYPINNSYEESDVYKKRAKEEFTEEEWIKIWDYAKEVGIDISASVFCSRGVHLLKKLGCSYVKIASTDLTNHMLIKEVCINFETVLISTGMASMNEISDAINCAKEANSDVNLKLFHCVSLYPCPFKDSKISRIIELKEKFNLDIGYSDHTDDFRSAILAWNNGATIFEKHFTYDKNEPGFDHAHAQDPLELQSYVRTIKSCSKAMKWSEKSSQEEDLENITKIRARRGVYVNKNIQAGMKITKDDLLYVRPSSTYECFDPEEFIGLKAIKPILQYSAIGIKSGYVEKVDSNWVKANKYWVDEMKEKNMDDE